MPTNRSNSSQSTVIGWHTGRHNPKNRTSLGTRLSLQFRQHHRQGFHFLHREFLQRVPSTIHFASLDEENGIEAMWRIPSFDQIFTTHSRRQRTSSSPSAIEGYRQLRSRIEAYPAAGDALHSQACQAYLIAMEYLHNRKPFISREGYVGLVPAH